jgi:hypothetical protein
VSAQKKDDSIPAGYTIVDKCFTKIDHDEEQGLSEECLGGKAKAMEGAKPTYYPHYFKCKICPQDSVKGYGTWKAPSDGTSWATQHVVKTKHSSEYRAWLAAMESAKGGGGGSRLLDGGDSRWINTHSAAIFGWIDLYSRKLSMPLSWSLRQVYEPPAG